MHEEPVTFKPGDDTNTPLNVSGRTHAREAGGELPDTIDKIYSSPLLRAKETAEIIAEMKKIDPSTIKFCNELIESYQGSLEGLTKEQEKEMLGGRSRGSRLLCNYDYTPWGGDSWKTIHDRVNSFFKELRSSDNDGNIVCVTSAGVIRMAYKIFFWEKSPGITKHILVKNGSVHEFVI